MAHIEQRGKNSWRLTVVIGYDNKGKPIRERKTIKAKNSTEAKKQLAIFESSILRGEYANPEKMTVSDLIDEWDEHVELSPRTKYGYRNVLYGRFKPRYGHMNATELKPIHILNFINDLQKESARLDKGKGKLSTSSISNCYKAVNSLLTFAKNMTWIHENPAENITPPTVKHGETKIYKPNELSILINGMESLKVEFSKRTLVAIALSSSARQSEIGALEEKHCDFDRGGIHIKQSLTLKTGEGVILKGTKNKRTRFITLPEEVMKMIKKLLHTRKQEIFMAGEKREWPDHLFLFANEFGKPYRPDSLSQWWSRFTKSEGFKSLGLEAIRFHDLRHSSLTYLSSRGLRLKAVQERAGHAKMGTTFDIYGHTLPEEDIEAALYSSEIFQKTDGN